MASLFPILTNLGVSKLSAASVITATTAFCIGPASAISTSACTIINIDPVDFFINYQIGLVMPLSICMMITYYFVNRYYDKKDNLVSKEKTEEQEKLDSPLIYAIIPILPIILLIVFSEMFSFFAVPITLDTTTAMLISLFVAILFELIRTRNIREVFDSFKIFWNGMGNIFKTVVTLIIAADIFASGLIGLGFIEGLIAVTQNLGLNAIGISIVMTIMIFLASMLMGSGNASFFAFGPLVPKIATKLGIESTTMILPMQLASSMGRTVSPVSGIIIAVSEIAGVTALDIVKRNIIPLGVTLIVMMIFHFI
jgi:DcuC family C4-dicarboxylate transporter